MKRGSSAGRGADWKPTRFKLARWVEANTTRDLEMVVDSHTFAMAKDLDGAPVFLTPTAYGLKYEEERAPAIRFTDIKSYQARGGLGAVKRISPSLCCRS